MSDHHNTDCLIIGAGPYGLAMAMVAQAHRIDHLVVGHPMSFWKQHMPSGMRLRTPCDWHTTDALEQFRQQLGLRPEQIDPVPLDFFIAYVERTIESRQLPIVQTEVERLCCDAPGFTAQLRTGATVSASRVVVATGYHPFRHIPDELARMLPEGRFSHSSDIRDPEALAGRRCLIIGGRQSAFELAGLLGRHAAQVDIVYRHRTPVFKRSDWSWAYRYIERMRTDPGWYRRLSQAEQKAINQRFWKEGRLELEAWLLDDLDRPNIAQWPATTVIGCDLSSNGDMKITLSNRSTLPVDHTILATGYQVDLRRLSFLDTTTIQNALVCNDGYPMLDESFQSSLPGLYFTGIHAVNDFGPFLFFVAGAFAAAEIIGNAAA